MTAREDESKLVVRDGSHLVLRLCQQGGLLAFGIEGGVLREGRLAVREPALSADPVDRAIPRGGGDPRARVVRDATGRPRLQGRDEGLLDDLLGKVEVAEDPDQRRDGPPVLLPEDTGDDLAVVGQALDQPSSRTGRISTVPIFAPGIRAAASIASSRPGTSIR